MDSNFNEFMDEFNVHTSTSNSNPLNVNKMFKIKFYNI